MTETEYVLSHFEEKFHQFLGKRIVLHGSRQYAEAIIDRFHPIFHFAGIMSRDPLESPLFHSLPVLREEDIPLLEIDMIILTERVKHAEKVYRAIWESCERNGILLYNMYGLDELETHRDLQDSRLLDLKEWKQLCAPYQIVAFEVMDTFFRVDQYSGELIQREEFRVLALWLLEQGIDLKFSLRKSAPEEMQRKALHESLPLPDLETRLIRRQGEDLSFRFLREDHPAKKILYIGNGLVNECILPRCYGIDTYWFQTRSYVPLMPVGSRDERIPFDTDQAEKIRERIDQSSVISFDVFDTLLLRKTLFPRDVFALTEYRGKRLGCPVEGFAAVREAAERELGGGNLYAIYDRIRTVCAWDEELTRKMCSLELEVEYSVIVPRTEVTALLDYAVRQGKTVVLTSDMYLPEPLFRDLLREKDISGFDRLFVSCDCGKGKMDGLFDELRRMHKGGEKILHIGDDPEADGRACERYGIDSLIIPSVLTLAVSQGWRSAILSARTLTERCLVGMALTELFRDPFQNPNLSERASEERLKRFAIGAVAPLAIGHMSWMLAKLKETPCDGVLFLARDGCLPMKIYQALDFYQELPPATYYYANRRSSFLCCADDDRYIPMIAGFGNHFELSPPEILSTLYSLPEDRIEQQNKGESAAEYIRRHWGAVSEVAKKARQGYHAYTERLGLKDGGRYAVVDFIARGTTQMYMERFLPFTLFGLYFGSETPDERLCRDIDHYLTGRENETLLKNFIELESAFISPEPSVDHISPGGEVVFSEEIRDRDEIDGALQVHEFVLRFSKEFFSLFYETGEVIRSQVPAEMFAADGCHWVQSSAYDDWAKRKTATKNWQNSRRTETADTFEKNKTAAEKGNEA